MSSSATKNTQLLLQNTMSCVPLYPPLYLEQSWPQLKLSLKTSLMFQDVTSAVIFLHENQIDFLLQTRPIQLRQEGKLLLDG